MNFLQEDILSISLIPEIHPFIEAELNQNFNSENFNSDINGYGYGGTFELSKSFLNKRLKTAFFYNYFEKNLDGSSSQINISSHDSIKHSFGISVKSTF
jgi:hypothetical protein